MFEIFSPTIHVAAVRGEGFVDFLILIAILLTMMMPILAIPYIFMKLGSLAAKVQGAVNSVGRSAKNSATRAGKGLAKDQYKNSGFAQARNMRKEARGIERRRRALNGEGIGGKLFNAESSLSGRLPRTAGQKAGDKLMRERIEAVQRKESDERIANAHRNLTPHAALKLAGGTPPVPLNAADDAAIKYMNESGITADSELSARALGSYLHKTGFMTADVNKKLIDSVGPAGTPQANLARAKLNDVLNAEAQAGNQHHLGYGSVDANGNFQIAGQKAKGGSTADGIREIIQSKGIAAMPKEMYSDPDLHVDVATAVQQLYFDKNTEDQFMRGTLNLSKGKEVQGIADMLGMPVEQFEAQRQAYADKYKGG